MPSKKQYNLVSDDAYDSRIPLYNEEAFQHGITFHAKYIGSLDVPRPSSRVEIVAAMRRIRYEFKAKSMKKKKVSLTVSVDGVKIALRNKRKTNQWPWDENKFIIMHHPIYRIFYVSHDSQDLKIFSYIARDGGTNAFKCNVFKSKKKSQAMRIVRTVGQAFEVCHKLSLALATSTACNAVHEDNEEDTQLPDHSHKGKCQGDGASEPNSCDTQTEEVVNSKIQEFTASPLNAAIESDELMKKLQNEEPKSYSLANESSLTESASYNFYQHIQLLREQMEQQSQQMQAVVGQVQMLKDQLAAETNARLEAQAQNQHLLAHNRELLEHITKLVKHFHDVEQMYHINGKSDNQLLPESLLLPQYSKSNIPSPTLPILRHHTEGARKKSSNEAVGRSVPEGVSSAASHESFSVEGIPNSFGRQLSVPSVSFPCSSGSPRLGACDPFLPGLSLPGSPSQRSFEPDSESIFKTNSFLNASPKQSRMLGVVNQTSEDVFSSLLNVHGNESNTSLEPSPLFYRSASSPGNYNLGDKNQKFDFSSSALFQNDTYDLKLLASSDHTNIPSVSRPVQDTLVLSKFSSRCNQPAEEPAKTESFIAQVTRDLAKMNVVEKESHSGFPSLFRS